MESKTENQPSQGEKKKEVKTQQPPKVEEKKLETTNATNKPEDNKADPKKPKANPFVEERDPDDPELKKKPLPEHCDPEINKRSFFVMTTKDRTNLDLRNAPFPKDLPYEKLITKFSEKFLEGYEIRDLGIFSTDKEVVKKQGGLIKEVITQIVKNIAKGGGSMSLSLPVRIFEPRTMLERITDWWAFAPLLLKQAAFLKDPVEVMKKVICFSLSGLFRSTQQLKPFNPMLGETYQAHWEDGTRIYMEHTSHIPPVSHFLIEDSDKLYRLSGYFDMALDGILKSMMSNSMGLIPKGKVTVKFFRTGQTIDFQLPKCTIGGAIFGERYVVFNGMSKFEDRQNNLKAVVCFNKSRKELATKRVHDIYGRILKYDYKKHHDEPIIGEKFYVGSVPAHPFPKHKEGLICEITGSWLEDIRFNGMAVYSICDTHAPQIFPDEVVLPSDSRYREDKKWMRYAWDTPDLNKLYMDYCQGWKWALEAQQRLERGLRNAEKERKEAIAAQELAAKKAAEQKATAKKAAEKAPKSKTPATTGNPNQKPVTNEPNNATKPANNENKSVDKTEKSG